MNDDGGVLGRLPHSRPGTRSEKRTGGGPAKPPRAPAPKKATRPRKAAGEKPRDRTVRPAPARASGKRPAHSAPPERRGDPLTEALRAGAKVAEGGVKLAGGLTRELLRRLPRP